MINVNFNVLGIQCFREIKINYTCVILVVMWWRVDCWFDEEIVVN